MVRKVDGAAVVEAHWASLNLALQLFLLGSLQMVPCRVGMRARVVVTSPVAASVGKKQLHTTRTVVVLAQGCRLCAVSASRCSIVPATDLAGGAPGSNYPLAVFGFFGVFFGPLGPFGGRIRNPRRKLHNPVQKSSKSELFGPISWPFSDPGYNGKGELYRCSRGAGWLQWA